MAKKNQVTLTFAGDGGDLEKAFDKVGDSADSMAKEVDAASDKVKASGEGFDRASESADALDTRAMGFRDTVTGLQDGFAGLTDSSASLGERLLLLGMGVGDLASGFVNFLLPNLKSAVTRLGQTRVGTLAVAAAQRVSAVATTAWTAATNLLSAAWRKSPLGVIIGLLTTIAGAIAIAWNKSETFRKIVTGAFNVVRNVIRAVTRAVVGAWDWVWGKLTTIAEGIGKVFGSVARGIESVFKGAVNFVIDMLNGIVDGINWVIRNWNDAAFLPGTFSEIGRIPRLHQGGIVPGAPGQEVPAILQAGERVIPASRAGGRTVTLRSDGSALAELVIGTLRDAVREEGGGRDDSVQFVLGPSDA